MNSNAPEDEYLIPLKLTWTGPLQAEQIVFPKPERMTSSFSTKPLVVFTGAFEIATRFKVPANAPDGPNLATGKLRYQACNDKECLRPQTVDVNLSLENPLVDHALRWGGRSPFVVCRPRSARPSPSFFGLHESSFHWIVFDIINQLDRSGRSINVLVLQKGMLWSRMCCFGLFVV